MCRPLAVHGAPNLLSISVFRMFSQYSSIAIFEWLMVTMTPKLKIGCFKLGKPYVVIWQLKTLNGDENLNL